MPVTPVIIKPKPENNEKTGPQIEEEKNVYV
jgi:hypothetical protein